MPVAWGAGLQNLGAMWRATTDPTYCDAGSRETTCYVYRTKTFANGTNITGGGNIVIMSGGRYQNLTPGESISISISGNLTIQSGGWIEANLSNLSADTVTIESGGLIFANALGYLGGYQPGNASGNGQGGAGGGTRACSGFCTGGGGGHGGVGGQGSLAGATGGAVTDSASNPIDFGSGGAGGSSGTSEGGNGGGLIKITATTAIVVNGNISANGGTGDYGAGGGAGGTIHLTAPSITGTAALRAFGGDGGYNSAGAKGGGGGGGRIYVNSNTFFTGTVLYVGGITREFGDIMAPGSLGSYHADIPSADALCDSGTLAVGCTINTTKALSQNHLSFTADSLTISSTGVLQTSAASDWLTLNLSGDLTVDGALIANIKRIDADDVVVNGTGSITGNVGAPDGVNFPGIVAATLTTYSGSTITAAGKGQAGAYSWSGFESVFNNSHNGLGGGGGVRSNGKGGGGGYGGAGGQGSDAGATGGSIYGTDSDPVDYGSGGAGGTSASTTYYGGNGGGVVRLTTTGAITLGGSFFATGNTGNYAGGGGSGGTIRLKAGTVSGGIRLRVYGGAGSSNGTSAGGGGGGGRVRVESANQWTGLVGLTGGATSNYNSGTTATAGATGTFYMALPNADAFCDLGTIAGVCTVSARKQLGTNQLTWTPNELVVTSTGIIEAPSNGNWLSFTLSGPMTLDGTITANIKKIQTTTFTMGLTGLITGNLGSPNVAADPGLVASASSVVNGRINASSKGEAGGWRWSGYSDTYNSSGSGLGTGAGAYSSGGGGGGGYGGAGGRGGGSASSAGISYGSYSNPSDYGSGGAVGTSTSSFGGNGGGVIRINVTGSLTLNYTTGEGGLITGGGDSSYASGGGSGGTIHVTATSIVTGGATQFQAYGGNSSTLGTVRGGGGAGGRIYLSASNLHGGIVYIGGGGHDGTGSNNAEGGRPGTYYASLPSGDSICDSGTLATTCTISTTKTLAQNTLSITGNHLTINSGVTLRSADAHDWLSMLLSGDLTVAGSLRSNIQALRADDVVVETAGLIRGNIGAPNETDYPGILANTVTINGSGAISADSYGHNGGYSWDERIDPWSVRAHSDGAGPGGGLLATAGNIAGGGGANGGAGGNGSGTGATGGAAYGSTTHPDHYGSGGAGMGAISGYGGDGGGMIRMTIDGAFSFTGSGVVTANGSTSLYAGGGGAGGSITLQVGSITGGGTVRANGAAGTTYSSNYGGGGGGGRISIRRMSGAAYGGTLAVNGGASGGGTATAGSVGTIYQTLMQSALLAGNPSPWGNVDGTSATSRFASPKRMATDGTYLYVADQGSYTIRRVTISDGTTTTIAGSPWQKGTTDATGASARFSSPDGVAIDGTHLYVAEESHHVIRKIDLTTNAVTTIAGIWNDEGSTNNATGTSARFNYPKGLTVTGGFIYVADGNNCKIRKVSTTSPHAVSDFTGSGTCAVLDGTGTAAQHNYPHGVTTDGTDLYIHDHNTVIRKAVLSTGVVTTVFSEGDWNRGEIVLAGTDLYVNFVNAIGRYDLSGSAWSEFAGARWTAGSVDSATPTSARFNGPRGLAVVGSTLYVADDTNGLIRTVNRTTGAVSTLTATQQVGLSPGFADGTGSAAKMDTITGMTASGTYLYAAEEENQIIRRIDLTSGAATHFSGTVGSHGQQTGGLNVGRLSSPHQIATDGTVIYSIDRSGGCQIRKTTIATQNIETAVAGDGTCGFVNGAAGSARFLYPTGLAYDPSGNDIYIADQGNELIRKLDLDTSTVSTFAGTQGTEGGANGIGTAATFDKPYHLLILGGYLYVTEYSGDIWAGNTVRKIDLATQEVTTLAGSYGQFGYVDATGSSARFDGVNGITSDGIYLYVAETNNHTIRRIDPVTGKVVTYLGSLYEAADIDGLKSATRTRWPRTLHYYDGGIYFGSQHNVRYFK